jgi:predicted HicB family RNase H-like nuclease
MAEKRSYGRSKTGVELTEDVLERMAAEAEAGLDVMRLRRRPGRPAMGSGPADTLPVRLEPELREAVAKKAAAERTTASEVVRAALRHYLHIG